MNNDWRYIGSKDKLRVIGPVEEEEKFMLRMVPDNVFQRLISKPTYTFQLPF